MKKDTFDDILHRLSLQSGQEKLHTAFQLSRFVKNLRTEGDLYTGVIVKHPEGVISTEGVIKRRKYYHLINIIPSLK